MLYNNQDKAKITEKIFYLCQVFIDLIPLPALPLPVAHALDKSY